MLARATLHSTMSLRVTCLQWFNAELRKAQSLTAVLVGELCKAAYDLLEAAAPLTYKQQQSIRRYWYYVALVFNIPGRPLADD